MVIMDLTDVTKQMLDEMPKWESVKSVVPDVPNPTEDHQPGQPVEPLQFRIRVSDKFIQIEFNKPLTKFALNREQAMNLGQILTQRGATLK
jgi:hypothetical protein